MIFRATGLMFVLLTGTAAAEMTVVSQTWVCERGVTVPMTLVSDAKGAIVVMNIDGRQITLHAEPDADGTRFSWPSGGSGYVWAEALGIASVLWRDGTDGNEATLLVGCRPEE